MTGAETALLATLEPLDTQTPTPWADEKLRCCLLVLWTHVLANSSLPTHLADALLRDVAGAPAREVSA